MSEDVWRSYAALEWRSALVKATIFGLLDAGRGMGVKEIREYWELKRGNAPRLFP